MANAMGNGRIDGQLSDIALHSCIVMPATVVRQGAALHFHFVGGLPATQNHLTHSSHGLAVRAEHADGAQVVQNVFCGNGFFSYATLGKRQVLGNGGVQMVADHQHVHMFIQGVDGVRSGGIGRGRQNVVLTHNFHDVGCVPTTSAFGVKGVDGATLEGSNGVFHKARLIECVRVDGHLGVGEFCNTQAVVDGCWRRAPIFMKFESYGASIDLLMQGIWKRCIAFAKKAQIHGKRFCRLQHPL